MVVLKEGNMKLQRQKHSEDVVKRNLMGYYQEKKRKIDETFSHIKSKISCFQNLLENFEENLEKVNFFIEGEFIKMKLAFKNRIESSFK